MKSLFQKKSFFPFSLYSIDFLDHFDMAVYSFVAAFLAKKMGIQGKVQQSLWGYGVLASSCITYPIGVFIFGFLARFRGPLFSLRLSVLGLGLATCMMAFLSASFHGFLGLIFCRFLQSMCAAGERSVSKLYLLQGQSFVSARKRSQMISLSTMLGILIAYLISQKILSEDDMSLWRQTVLIGGLLMMLSFIMRFFQASSLQMNLYEKSFVLDKKYIYLAFLSAFSYMTYAVPFQFFYALDLREHFLGSKDLLYFFFLDLACLAFFPFFLRKIDHLKILQNCLWIGFILSLPLFIALDYMGPKTFLMFLIRSFFVLVGVAYAVVYPVFKRSFFQGPLQYFWFGMVSIVGSAVLGHPLSFLLLWIYQKVGGFFGCGAFLSFFSFLCLKSYSFLSKA